MTQIVTGIIITIDAQHIENAVIVSLLPISSERSGNSYCYPHANVDENVDDPITSPLTISVSRSRSHTHNPFSVNPDRETLEEDDGEEEIGGAVFVKRREWADRERRTASSKRLTRPAIAVIPESGSSSVSATRSQAERDARDRGRMMERAPSYCECSLPH
jgi:hypothetical protein